MNGTSDNLLPFLCPQPPSWKLDWEALDSEHDWIRAMRGCVQDPIFHAEGDVWNHVRLVCEVLSELPEWRALQPWEREIVFAAALLHDEAKPTCTREEGGRIRSHGHSARGAIDARRILWELGADFVAREQVCALVRHHQAPLHLVNREDSQRLAFLISQTARSDLLAILAKADVMGRKCNDQRGLLEKVALFEEYCKEQGCFTGPRVFPSPHSRFEYFRTENRNPDYLAHEEFCCEVVLMSGLPGAGKDWWITKWLPERPVISLDNIRQELDEPSTGKQGAVVHEARERAREHLRAHRSFIWNATNLSRAIRTQLVDLFTNYHARVRIVYVEASADSLYAQNATRKVTVPAAAIQKMMLRWEIPSPIEADEVEWWIDQKYLTL